MPNIIKLQCKTCLTCLMYTLFLSLSSLANTFYDRKSEGWHWYKDRIIKKELKKNPKKTKQETMTQKESINKEMEDYKKELDYRMNKAILYPTPQNVKNFMMMNMDMLNRSNRFKEVFEYVLYNSAKLDPTVKNPTSQVALPVYYQQEKIKLENTLKKLSKTYGLFFFYSGNCPYCHKMAPIVKNFAAQYNWEVKAISMDGGKLAEFPNAVTDNGAARILNIQNLPALMAVDPVSEKVIPLSFGIASQDIIERRAYVLANFKEKTP